MARRFVERCRRAAVAVPPCCFLAWEQTAGRGRGGRTWTSEAGLGLYMTLLLPGVPAATVRQLPMAVAVALAQAVAGCGVEARIKWPNDLLSRGRKLAGILLETSSATGPESVTLAGIGVNVHHDRDALPVSGATSLALEGAAPDTAGLAVEICRAVDAFLASPVPMADVVAGYRGWSVHAVGDALRCRRGDGFVAGEFAGFGEDGSLLLETGGRLLRLASSEIVES